MARFDYVRVGLVYDVRTAGDLRVKEQVKDDWEAAMNLIPEPAYKVSKVMVKGGAYMDIYECWGMTAELLVDSPFLYENANRILPLRIDYRVELSEDVKTDQVFYAIHAKSNSNVQTFNSRTRNKSDDRDAGGQGFSVGSHKSDRRLVVYQRGHERPALEVQTRKRLLIEPFKAARSAYMNSMAGGQPIAHYRKGYQVLKDWCAANMEAFVLKHSGNTVSGIYSGQIILSEEAQEKLLVEVEQRLQAMNDMARQSLLDLYSGHIDPEVAGSF
jgi:hypothetical protein